jgi:hypothetical protein
MKIEHFEDMGAALGTAAGFSREKAATDRDRQKYLLEASPIGGLAKYIGLYCIFWKEAAKVVRSFVLLDMEPPTGCALIDIDLSFKQVAGEDVVNDLLGWEFELKKALPEIFRQPLMFQSGVK